MKEPEIGAKVVDILRSRSPDGPMVIKFSDGTAVEVYGRSAEVGEERIKMVRGNSGYTGLTDQLAAGG